MIPEGIDLAQINSWHVSTLVSNLGIEITAYTSHTITATMPVDHRTRQPHGLLHGGASVVLAETLGSVGSNMIVNKNNQVAVGLEINANHIKSVKEGYVTGVATLIHAGRNTHIWETKINNQYGQLVCISRLTVAIIDKKS
jgi:1,4-dihydroxy-2-naphthoyl-CoA hydrolase